MSYGPPRRYRAYRGSSLVLPPGMFARTFDRLRRADVLLRLLLAFLAALVMWLVTQGWAPTFSYRSGYVPPREIMARVPFSIDNPLETQQLREKARNEAECVYRNDLRPLEEKRQEMANKVSQLILAESFEKVDQKLWAEFVPASEPVEISQQKFAALKAYFAAGMSNDRFDEAVKAALSIFEKNGLLLQLTHKTGSNLTIKALPVGSDVAHRADVNDVLIGRNEFRLKQRLLDELRSKGGDNDNSSLVSELAFAWLYPTRLPTTLTLDDKLSNSEAERAESEVPVQKTNYEPGKSSLAAADVPLGDNELKLLRTEYNQWRSNMTLTQRLNHSMATFGMYVALYVLCGFYIFHRKRQLLTDLRKYATLLTTVVITVTLCWFASADQWRAEIIPLLLFGMTAAIAYEKELALLLAASASLIMAFSLEQGLGEFVILVSSVAAAVLLLQRIRSRTKLIYVGAFTGCVVMLTTIGVSTLVGQAYGATNIALALTGDQNSQIFRESFPLSMLMGAAWFGFCSLLAGLLITGLLPFIERMFDVQTDISLLELGDVQHPLLQELIRRAPGTYNHSINVASIAETASEAIGANGLLVRVGAYFHDVGKMLKPSYFVENQGSEGNRHESLQPAMSTLVIIAHVKDGADLARQHHLPQPIIDFIEQHHGTTLVEYFYRREAKRLEQDPDAGELDESTFRYPGPKPQTKETAVMMLADVVESASRALIEPTPSRIESLVHDMAMKRLLDGQFDECGLTLQELRTIEDSLVKSLTAVYHGRVKYPEHQTV